MVLGVLWQLVKLDLFLKVGDIAKKVGSEFGAKSTDAPEDILLRWVNFNLKQANHPKTISNFGNDIKVDTNSSFILITQQLRKIGLYCIYRLIKPFATGCDFFGSDECAGPHRKSSAIFGCNRKNKLQKVH